MRARAYFEATVFNHAVVREMKYAHTQVCPDAEEVEYLNPLSERGGGKGAKKDAAAEEWRRTTRERALNLRVQHERQQSKIFEMIYPTTDLQAQEIYSRCHDASLAVFRAMFGGGGGGVAKLQPAEKNWEQCLRSPSSAFTPTQSSAASPSKRSLDTERAGTIMHVDAATRAKIAVKRLWFHLSVMLAK